MRNKTISFRPKLEGAFRTRFYDTASKINASTSQAVLDKYISDELDWVENVCVTNIEQRKKYRAVWLLLRDLVRASWSACYRDGIFELSLPTLNAESINALGAKEEKDKLRSWLSESRLERLYTFENFIRSMEVTTSSKRSILTLVADGNELADRLLNANDIRAIIQPHLELVSENKRDNVTNHRLSDIWRYFRLTWATPSENTPGRTMQYLIRDYAVPEHPVMGIISLENCAVQITDRDKYIGWNAREFIEDMLAHDTAYAYDTILMLLKYIEDGIGGIKVDGICKPEEVNHPTDDIIQRLIYETAGEAEKRRQELLKDAMDDDYELADEDKSELGGGRKYSIHTEDALYQRKRAEQLARLLIAKKDLTGLVTNPDFENCWREFLFTERAGFTDQGHTAIRNALVAQKSKHIGSSMLELNVCGAIPPYNEVLGGKLAALFALSPQIINDYNIRYGNRESEIATRLKGAAVVRSADLVYVGTTSLYYVGSSQYNRLKLPREILGGDYDIKWLEIGKTNGFGTLHIGRSTTAALVEAAEHIGFTRINHVFGEGASPKLRLVNLSIRELLEVTPDDASELAKHAMSRIVYGAFLAKNAREYLLGKNSVPEYYFDNMSTDTISEKTTAITHYWSERWLGSRVKYKPIYERLRNFDKESIRVSKQLKESAGWEYKRLKEDNNVETASETAMGIQLGLDFVRSLYRGSSAYADKQGADLLTLIHIPTPLDDAVQISVKKGNDVVLTGSPGDGKTHIIRVLDSKLAKLPKAPVIELDASCLTNDELHIAWKQAREDKRPFVLAINAAVLFSLAEQFPDFQHATSAAQQVSNAVIFDDDAGKNNIDGVSVFDLSRREVLHGSIVGEAIKKITDSSFYHKCEQCQYRAECDVMKNRELLNDALFQDRLDVLFERVALKGQHVSLRELLSFLSYLIFGNRNCPELMRTSGNNQHSLLTLIYKDGKGSVFDYVRESFDPSLVSHPVYDEDLLAAKFPSDSWSQTRFDSPEAIDEKNTTQFDLRKREFFFFNKGGDILLRISDDDVGKFQALIEKDDKSCIKELIGKLNAFFGRHSKTELDMWHGHRFNNSPRKVLISAGKLKASDFAIGRPRLIHSMQEGIQTRVNYIRLQRKKYPETFLKVDWELFCLLLEAERGVPMLLIKDNVTTKRIWRFIEQLQQQSDIDGNDELAITIFDIDDKKELIATIDREDVRYSALSNSEKVQM
jgi:hypothetical protein